MFCIPTQPSFWSMVNYTGTWHNVNQTFNVINVLSTISTYIDQSVFYISYVFLSFLLHSCSNPNDRRDIYVT